MAFQSTYDKPTLSQSPTNVQNYHENENGLKYGFATDATFSEPLPDLILAGSVDSTPGYMLKKDYLGERGLIVSLYDIDGKTIIGSIRSDAMNPKAPIYPKNENGQTYGSGADASSPETVPDLIRAIGVDGTEGYLLREDLDGELPKSPEEAIEIQNSRPSGGRDIPLYDVDGETVIGVFHVG